MSGPVRAAGEGSARQRTDLLSRTSSWRLPVGQPRSGCGKNVMPWLPGRYLTSGGSRAGNLDVTNVLRDPALDANIRSIDRMFVTGGAQVTHVQPEESATIPAAPDALSGRAGARIVALDCYDVRFPTSLEHHGSDAMNPDPDYSAAYAVLRTDADGLEGHALCFTIGRGNDVMVSAVGALRQHVVGKYVADIVGDLGGFSASHDRRQPAAVARPGEGRHAHGHRRRGQRRLGPRRQGGGQAALAAARRHDARADRRADRLPLPRGRADPRGGAGHPPGGPGRPGRADRGARAGRATPRTRRRPAGSATPTRSWPSCPGRRSPTGSPRSS